MNQREWKKGKEVYEIEAFFVVFSTFAIIYFETVHNILFHVSGSPSVMYFSSSYCTKMFATSYNK